MRRCGISMAVVALAALGCRAWCGEADSTLERPSVERLFAAMCAHCDQSYVACRDLLVERGQEALPFLREKAKSGTPDEQLAAEDAILHITDAASVQRWRAGLWWEATFKFRDDGTVLSIVRRGGETTETVYDRKAVPFLIGELWRWGPSTGNVPRCYRMLAHLSDGRAVWPLALRAHPGDSKSAWQEALLSFGRKATPALRSALKRHLRTYRPRGQYAAEVLGQLGDPAAAPELKHAVRDGVSYVALAAARALCRMKHPDAAETVWPVLLELASLPGTRGVEHRRNLYYHEVRDALGLLGDALAPFVRAKRAEAEDERTRVVCDGLLARFEGPEAFQALLAAIGAEAQWPRRVEPYPIPRGKMSPMVLGFLIEEATLLHNPRAVLTLGLSREPRAFPAIAADLPHRRYGEPAVATQALGDLGDPRGIALLVPIATDPARYAPGYDPRRWAAWSIFRIGGPQAAKALRGIAAANEELRTEAVLYADVLEGKLDEARRLLESQDEALRSAAARALVARRDVQALPAFLDHLGSLRGLEYRRLRPYLAALGKERLPALRQELQHEDWRHRLPAESALMELTRPEAFQRCHDLLWRAAADIAPMHVHHYGMIDSAAKGIAAQVAAEDVACFEEATYFASNDRRTLVAGLAAAMLGYLKQERSLPVLAASARMPGFEGVSPVFEALKKFGDKGAEVAAKLPPPDPAKPRFASRHVRTVHAADMLAGLDHAAAVEKLLGWHRAWKAADKRQRRSMDLRRFFQAARKAPDPKLLPALLELFPHTEGDSYTCSLAALALESYDDERVIPPILSALSCYDLELPVLETLTRRAGDRAPGLLAEAFAKLPPRQARPVAQAIAALAAPRISEKPLVAEGWYGGAYNSREKIDAAVALARRVALPVLHRALEEPSSERSAAAVHGLVRMHDAGTQQRIAQWVAAGGNFQWGNYAIALYLEGHKPKGAAPGILAAFRKQPSNTTLMRLVEAYRLEAAIPELREQLVKAPSKVRGRLDYGVPAAAASTLASVGEAGRDALAAIAAGGEGFAPRLYAAHALASRRDPRGVPPAVALLRGLDRERTAHPALHALDKGAQRDMFHYWMHLLLEALGTSGGEEERRLLRQISALHPDEVVRGSASRALERLAQQQKKP